MNNSTQVSTNQNRNKNQTLNPICQLFNIDIPIIQAGMVWVSGSKLATACSENGILGMIGAGSMDPELLRQHIAYVQAHTHRSFAVNIPLLYHRVEEQVQVCLDMNVKIIFTSAGSPKRFTPMLKDHGITVVHVTSSPELALKCEKAGVDAVVAEGFEAGGHNGRDEITTLVLVPQVVDTVKIPVIAAGGIVDGRGIAACLALGAHGVQMGTRFVATVESSAHLNFKEHILQSGADATMLALKKLVPVRLMKNAFYQKVSQLEKQCASVGELEHLLGKGRARLGMFEGDLDEGELEIGQACALVEDIPTVAQLVQRLKLEFMQANAKRINF